MKKLFLLVVVALSSCALSFGQGTIRGKITDENGEALIGVTVVLKENRTIGAGTDFDGNYTLKINDAGPQTLVVSYISYKTIEEMVHPVNDEVIIKNFTMVSATQEVKEVEITAKAVRAKDYYMEKVKMNSAPTLDFISSETMKKTGDANVTSAIARVPGVSTSGGLITVRGIGDRYVKTSINGSRIPTLDPFTNNIKLDIFPSTLVDNILITKTASPDLPGDWAGAYLSVETKDYPDQLTIGVESSIGYNNRSTFKDMLTSEKSSTDWLGYDNNYRDHDHNSFIPVNSAPSQYDVFVALGLGTYFNSMGVNKSWEGSQTADTYFKLGLVQLGLLAPALFDDPVAISSAKSQFENGPYKGQAFSIINAEAAKSGQSFPNNWKTFKQTTPLNFSQSFSIGNQTLLFGKPFGFIAGFRYGTSVVSDPSGASYKASVDANGIRDTAMSWDENLSRETNGWSALVNLAYKFNSNNSVSLLFMPNFTGINTIRTSSGKDNSSNYDSIFTNSQFYEQRKQLVYQFKSEHYIPSQKIKIESHASYTKGTSSVPDFKNFYYFKNNDGVYEVDRAASKTNRYYRYLIENVFDGRLSAEFPLSLKPGLTRKVKFGGAYQFTDKKYDQYDYLLQFSSGPRFIIENENFEPLFGINNFGLVNNNIPAYYFESGNPANHSIGTSKVIAGYAMIDYSINSLWRFSGGLRVENADIYTDVFKYDSIGLEPNDPRRQYLGEVFTPNPGTLNETSFLPSANFIYKLNPDEFSPTNLRFNYSQTVARPSIRELSETVVTDFELKAPVFGNSDLKMVKVNNYDVRFESYFKSGDNASVSLFYKNFRNHIELVKSNLGYSWQNVDKSLVAGIELEGKKALTRQLSLTANITVAYSETKFDQTRLIVENGIKTYTFVKEVKRSMFGQAPYVFNCIVTYTSDTLGLTAALSYNVQGNRLAIVSDEERIPDTFELPRHLLDFKVSKSVGKHFGVSLTIRDMLSTSTNRSYIFDGNEKVTYDDYGYGTNFTLSLSYKL